MSWHYNRLNKLSKYLNVLIIQDLIAGKNQLIFMCTLVKM